MTEIKKIVILGISELIDEDDFIVNDENIATLNDKYSKFLDETNVSQFMDGMKFMHEVIFSDKDNVFHFATTLPEIIQIMENDGIVECDDINALGMIISLNENRDIDILVKFHHVVPFQKQNLEIHLVKS